MTRRILVGLLVCGAVWASGTDFAWSHDDEWDGAYAEGEASAGPPDPGRLSLYGEWAWEPDHGRVWRPRVEAGWRPYWRGHWAWRGTWVWVSSDPWGDGPFHYGQWAWSPRLGWVWIPGSVWAPARVTWLLSGSIVAWAPSGIHVSVGYDPRFWVTTDVRAFRGSVVRPHRIPPPRANVRHAVPMRSPGRVFVVGEGRGGPEEPRAQRTAERRREVSGHDRGADHRRESRLRATHREPMRGRMAESRNVRGFDLRRHR